VTYLKRYADRAKKANMNSMQSSIYTKKEVSPNLCVRTVTLVAVWVACCRVSIHLQIPLQPWKQNWSHACLYLSTRACRVAIAALTKCQPYNHMLRPHVACKVSHCGSHRHFQVLLWLPAYDWDLLWRARRSLEAHRKSCAMCTIKAESLFAKSGMLVVHPILVLNAL